MQTGYELIAPAEGELDPTPTDLQIALTSKPMRIHPATCAVCDDFGALCDQIEGREGQHTTQSLSGVDRTDQRRLQLEAIGFVIQEVLFDVKPQPVLLKGLRFSGFIADHKPVLLALLGAT